MKNCRDILLIPYKNSKEKTKIKTIISKRKKIDNKNKAFNHKNKSKEKKNIKILNEILFKKIKPILPVTEKSNDLFFKKNNIISINGNINKKINRMKEGKPDGEFI